MLIAFRKDQTDTEDLSNAGSEKSGLDEIIALLHQNFANCFGCCQNYSFGIKDDPVIDQAIVVDLFDPFCHGLSGRPATYVCKIATVP